MEPDIVASVQQLPAHVDVVAGGHIYRVKAAYLQETLAPKRHVAARHVLGPLVVQEHVDRSPGRTPRTGPPAGRLWGRGSGPGARRPRHFKSERQVGEPVRIGLGVGVYVRHEFPLRLFEAHVASPGEPETIPREQSHRELTGDLRRRVRGPIVYP